MSFRDISPTTVLAAIRAGRHTEADLADTFGVLPSSPHLAWAIDALIAQDMVHRLPNGDLIPHDLLEDLEDEK